MAVTILVVVKGTVDADGIPLNFGGDDVPYQLAGTSPGAADKLTIPVGIGATVTLWDASLGAPPNFKLLVLSTDLTVMLEFQYGGSAANNGHLALFGGGPPLMLGADDGQAYNAGGNFAGTAAKVTKILAKNSGASAAKVTRVIVQ